MQSPVVLRFQPLSLSRRRAATAAAKSVHVPSAIRSTLHRRQVSAVATVLNLSRDYCSEARTTCQLRPLTCRLRHSRRTTSSAISANTFRPRHRPSHHPTSLLLTLGLDHGGEIQQSVHVRLGFSGATVGAIVAVVAVLAVLAIAACYDDTRSARFRSMTEALNTAKCSYHSWPGYACRLPQAQGPQAGWPWPRWRKRRRGRRSSSSLCL